jgi:hypothetical protein
MEGLSFGKLFNGMAEPDGRCLSGRGDQLPEFRGDLAEDGSPWTRP